MSIILEGIDLPKNKDDISLVISKDGKIYKRDDEEFDGNYYCTGYKAIQIPKGARLIDANAMLKDLRRRICKNVPVYKDEDVDVVISEIVKECQINSEIRTLGEWISKQPTIFESEVMPDE